MAVQITPIDGVAQPNPIRSDDPWYVDGSAYDWILAGLHFNEAVNESNPYESAFQRVTKEAIDQSSQPGDQSLDGWWVRSQTDWTGGAGYRFMEPVSQDPIPRTFWWSYGVNPWNEGQLYLHRVPSKFVSLDFALGESAHMIVGADLSGTEYLFVAAGVNIYRYPLTQVQSGVSLESPGTPYCVMPHPVVGLMTAEGYVYALTEANGMWRVQPTPLQFYRSTTQGYVQGWWVKDRLILAAGESLYEVAGETALVELDQRDPIVTVSESSWEWTSVTDGPRGILVAGRGRHSSSISLISLETDGGLPVLSAPFVVAEFPINEKVREISTYLSRFMMVSTNAGVRLAVIDADGTLTYGPLLRAPYLNGKFSNFDRFSWASVDDAGEGRSGLIRFSYADVSSETRVPWAMDIRVPEGGGQVQSQEVFSQDSLAMLAVVQAEGAGGTANVWVTTDESATESYGRIQSGSIRMGSTVKKAWSRINLVGNPQMVGEIQVEIVTGEYVASVGSLSNPEYDKDLYFPDERLTSGNASVRLTLRKASTADTSTAPVLGWSSNTLADNSSTEATLGFANGMLSTYVDFVNSPAFPTAWADAASERGSALLISWEPWDWYGPIDQAAFRPADIATGAYDTYIESWLADAQERATSQAIMVRFAPEMNDVSRPWAVGVNNGNTTADYIAMWQHVYTLKQQIAPDVIFVWNPLVYGNTAFDLCFPDIEFVDMLALNGFNRNVQNGSCNWQSPDDVFFTVDGPVDQLKALAGDKPWGIAEFASAPTPLRSTFEPGGVCHEAWGWAIDYPANPPWQATTDDWLTKGGFVEFTIRKALDAGALFVNMFEQIKDEGGTVVDWRVTSEPSAVARFDGIVDGGGVLVGNSNSSLTIRRAYYATQSSGGGGIGITAIGDPDDPALPEQRWSAILPYTWEEVAQFWLRWDDLGGGEGTHVPTPVDPGDGPISVEPVPPTSTPVVESWTLRAVPTIERTELVRIPLAVFDDEADSRGQQIGGSGTARLRYQALVERAGQGRPLTLINGNTGERSTVIVDEMSFRRTGKASKGSVFGGVIDIVARVL